MQIVDRRVKIQGQFVVYGEHIFLNTLSKGPVDKAESATVETVSSVHIFFLKKKKKNDLNDNSLIHFSDTDNCVQVIFFLSALNLNLSSHQGT